MTEETTTRALVARAQSGDRSAFDELAARYRDDLLRSARSRYRPADGLLSDPEDLVSETILRAFEGISSFQWTGKDSFSRWLFGICRNVRLTEIRRKRVTLSLNHARSAESEEPTPSRALGRRERFERLERAIAELPDEYREVLRQSRIEGLKTSEIAARLGKSPNAVKHILARAIHALRVKLDETGSLHLLNPEAGGDR